MSLPAFAVNGVQCRITDAHPRGRVPGLPIVFAGWGDPRANFLGSGGVVFWGFEVRCGRVYLSLQALAVYGGSVPNY